MATSKKQDPQEIHSHDWQISKYDYSEEHCKCGAIKVSKNEYERRCKVWDAYIEQVGQSEAYNDFKEMSYYFTLYKEHANPEDLEKIKEIDARVLARGKQTVKRFTTKDGREFEDEIFEPGSNLNKPKFFDPRTFNNYIIDS